MNKKILTIIVSILVMTLSIFGLSKSVIAKEVAYLSASSANTWLAASVKEMDAVASANGINIAEFDAQFDPAKQTAQLQDAIASGKYDGIILAAAGLNRLGLQNRISRVLCMKSSMIGMLSGMNCRCHLCKAG